MFIDIKIDVAASRNNGEQICLTGVFLNGRACASEQVAPMSAILRDKQVIGAILTDAEVIKFDGGTIGAENETAIIATCDGHLYLHGEVAKVGILRDAGEVKSLRIEAGMITAAAEGAASATLRKVNIPVVAGVPLNELVDDGVATGSLCVDALQGCRGSNDGGSCWVHWRWRSHS